MASSVLVIGSCEQFPNDLRAYHLMGTSTEGAVLLSRHGATYSAAATEVYDYPAMLERMLGVVLQRDPAAEEPTPDQLHAVVCGNPYTRRG